MKGKYARLQRPSRRNGDIPNKTTAKNCVGLFEHIPSTAGALEAVTYESKEANIDRILVFF
jgi:hypothetical protein